MIIDSTYFIRDISLDVGVYSNIASSITKYEPEILKELFGYANAKLISDDDSAAWVQAVRDGVVYTVGTETYEWIGLENTELDSLIAYYVYYYHIRNISSITVGTGNAQSKLENAQNVSFNQKIGAAWVRLQEHIASLHMMLSNEYTDVDFYPSIGSVNMFDL